MSDLEAGDCDDDLPQLSAHALAALHEFYDDQNSKLQALSTGSKDAKDVELDENWVNIILYTGIHKADSACPESWNGVLNLGQGNYWVIKMLQDERKLLWKLV